MTGQKLAAQRETMPNRRQVFLMMAKNVSNKNSDMFINNIINNPVFIHRNKQ